jgi:hypothetical protein
MALRQDQVPNDFCGLNLNGGERHSHLKSNARFFRQNGHRPATADLSQKKVIELSDGGRLALKVRFQVMLPAQMRLVAIGKLPPTNRAAPHRL